MSDYEDSHRIAAMPESTCPHSQPSPVGYTEMPVQRSDASVAGLTLYAGVLFCADCGELVVSVHLRPKAIGSSAVLVTDGFTALVSVPVRREVPSRGRAVRHG